MPAVTKDEALARLTRQVEEKLGPDELLEVYNELFPEDPYTEEEVHEDPCPLIEMLVDHIHGALEIEEVVALWGLIFSKHRNVWYDEEEQRIHYNEESETVSSE